MAITCAATEGREALLPRKATQRWGQSMHPWTSFGRNAPCMSQGGHAATCSTCRKVPHAQPHPITIPYCVYLEAQPQLWSMLCNLAFMRAASLCLGGHAFREQTNKHHAHALACVTAFCLCATLPPQLQQAKAEDALEAELGFPMFTNGDDRLGWLMNMQPVSALS